MSSRLSASDGSSSLTFISHPSPKASLLTYKHYAVMSRMMISCKQLFTTRQPFCQDYTSASFSSLVSVNKFPFSNLWGSIKTITPCHSNLPVFMGLMKNPCTYQNKDGAEMLLWMALDQDTKGKEMPCADKDLTCCGSSASFSLTSVTSPDKGE